MTYRPARRYPPRTATEAGTDATPVMIDGLEVVDEQVVVLAAPGPEEPAPRPGPATPRGGTMAWDSELEPLAGLVAGCADAAYAVATAVEVRRLVVDVPIELRASAGEGEGLRLDAAPPRQSLPTSVMPVLGRLSITVEAGP